MRGKGSILGYGVHTHIAYCILHNAYCMYNAYCIMHIVYMTEVEKHIEDALVRDMVCVVYCIAYCILHITHCIL